jgi:hypothetical protein
VATHPPLRASTRQSHKTRSKARGQITLAQLPYAVARFYVRNVRHCEGGGACYSRADRRQLGGINASPSDSPTSDRQCVPRCPWRDIHSSATAAPIPDSSPVLLVSTRGANEPLDTELGPAERVFVMSNMLKNRLGDPMGAYGIPHKPSDLSSWRLDRILRQCPNAGTSTCCRLTFISMRQ